MKRVQHAGVKKLVTHTPRKVYSRLLLSLYRCVCQPYTGQYLLILMYGPQGIPPHTHTHTHTHTPTHMESSSTSLLFGHSDTRHGDSQGAGGSGLSLLMSQRRKTSDHLNNIPKQVNVTKTHYYDLWWQKARGCTYCERKTLSYWQKSQLGRQHITLAVKISPNHW